MSLIDELSQAWNYFIRPEETARRDPGEATPGQLRPSEDCRPIGKLDNGNSLWECKSSYSAEPPSSLKDLADSLVDRIKGLFAPRRGTAGFHGGAAGATPPPASAPGAVPVPPKATSRLGK